jgi:predicted Holliday junction resolvase-like endonuclease
VKAQIILKIWVILIVIFFSQSAVQSVNGARDAQATVLFNKWKNVQEELSQPNKNTVADKFYEWRMAQLRQ